MNTKKVWVQKRNGLVALACVLVAAPTAVAEVGIIEGIQIQVDSFFGWLVKNFMSPVLFVKVYEIPVIVAILVLGGVIFTVRYKLVNLLLFRHAIYVIRGHYDNPDDEGEVSHFQALSAALAATVGLGNIAGVAIAITAGGPGAIFWMWVTAFVGMSTKFSECSLSQVYRDIKPDGHVIGGPMVYIRDGIRECVPSMAWFGIVMSPIYAVFIVFASFGGGNMFQSNQTYKISAQMMGLEDSTSFPLIIGMFLAALVSLVIIGGIKRIGEVTSRLVPAMCIGYVLVCVVIVFQHFSAVPGLIADIFIQAFQPDAAMYGGFVGVMVLGMQRAAFSNEAGLGSAAIAHAAARTNEPVREGTVAMLGPFIDTIVVCTMTALAILLTGVHLDYAGIGGVQVTAAAFDTVHPYFSYFLMVAVLVFAYSTIIAWGYYGERAMEFLSKGNFWAMWGYRAVFVIMVFVGPMLSLSNLVDFVDILFISTAVPNILAMILLSGKVAELKNDYIRRLQSGEMKVYK